MTSGSIEQFVFFICFSEYCIFCRLKQFWFLKSWNIDEPHHPQSHLSADWFCGISGMIKLLLQYLLTLLVFLKICGFWYQWIFVSVDSSVGGILKNESAKDNKDPSLLCILMFTIWKISVNTCF